MKYFLKFFHSKPSSDHQSHFHRSSIHRFSANQATFTTSTTSEGSDVIGHKLPSPSMCVYVQVCISLANLSHCPCCYFLPFIALHWPPQLQMATTRVQQKRHLSGTPRGPLPKVSFSTPQPATPAFGVGQFVICSSIQP